MEGLMTSSRLAGVEDKGGKPSTETWQRYWPSVWFVATSVRISDTPRGSLEPALVQVYDGAGFPSAW